MSTILEETEEQLLERSLRLNTAAVAAAHDLTPLQLSLLREQTEANSSEDSDFDSPIEDINSDLPANNMKTKTKSKPTKAEKQLKNTDKSKNDNSKKSKPELVRHPSKENEPVNKKTSKENLNSKTPELNRRNSREADGRKSAAENVTVIKSQKTKSAKGKENKDSSDVSPKTKLSLGSGKKTEPEKTVKLKEVIKPVKEEKVPAPTGSRTPRKTTDNKVNEIKRGKIQEPLRTPRVVEPNPLQIETEATKPKPILQSKNQIKATDKPPTQDKPNVQSKKKDIKKKMLNVASLGGQSIATDSEYYSDDFEDDGSCSEIEEGKEFLLQSNLLITL